MAKLQSIIVCAFSFLIFVSSDYHEKFVALKEYELENKPHI